LHITLSALSEIFVLVTALSIDTFIAFIACGGRGIKVPVSSMLIASGICSGVITASILVGSLLTPAISQGIAKGICFTILLVIGIVRIFDSSLKAWIRRSNNMNRAVRFTLFKLHFLLQIYADPEMADLDAEGKLSGKEAAVLAFALSFDGLAAGFGAGAGSTDPILTAALSFCLGMAAAALGVFIGRKIAKRSPVDLSPLSGALFIILAFMKL
jgi:putative sporulation protein YtaF